MPMRDVVRQLVSAAATPVAKLQVMREFLQIMILKGMSDEGSFDRISFVGGTALRIMYGVRRFSEDLDFSLIEPDVAFEGRALAGALVKRLERNGFAVETACRTTGAVQTIEFRFPGLVYDLGLSPQKQQKIMIKWEVDTNPPEGAVVVRTIVQRVVMFVVTHHDLPSLFAGKLHACLCRKYVKGRDWYDCIWYLGRNVTPNYRLLAHALRQTNGPAMAASLTPRTLSGMTRARIAAINFTAALKDMEQFLEDPSEAALFDAAAVMQLFDRSDFGTACDDTVIP